MKNELTLTTNSEKETMDFGEYLGRHAFDGLFIALTGDLGAGKTHFVQGLAKGMGIEGVHHYELLRWPHSAETF